MSGNTDINSQLHELMNEFDDEERQKAKMAEYIRGCSEEKLEEMLKKINPYGPVVQVSSRDEETVSFSYTNLRMEYARKLAAVGLVGFVNRMIKEYKLPEEVKPVDLEDYIANPALMNTPDHIKDAGLKAKWEEARASMSERVVIWTFFKYIFDFDPDRHVASALQTNKKDPTRKAPATPAVIRSLTAKKNAIRSSVKRQDWEATVDELTPVDGLTEIERAAFETIPSSDMFAKWDRYQEEHYEQLQDATKAVYGAVPDIDFLLNVYGVHANKEEARKFKDTHMNQVVAPITQITKNRWAILGPYQQNRERVDFMNQHTEVLKEMMDQRERDSHVATDIMKKRIKTKKAQNIAEAGPDDKAFLQYIKNNKPQISSLGGEHVKQDDADDVDDCPVDAVEVVVHKFSGGGMNSDRHKVFNPMEAPAGGGGETRKTHEELVADAKNLKVTEF